MGLLGDADRRPAAGGCERPDRHRATAIVVEGPAKAGKLDYELDVDFFNVTVAAGQRVGFDLDRPAGSSLDSVLRMSDATGC